MKKRKLKAKLIILLIIIAGILLISNITTKIITGNNIIDFFKTKQKTQTGNSQNIQVTKQNLALFLQNTNLVQEIHKDAEIELKLYNFDSGNRAWEESYVIRKGKVYLGSAENPDVIAVLNSKYVSELGNFCATMQKAKQNNDFGFELKKSAVKLGWTYKGMMKYKGCFGL